MKIYAGLILILLFIGCSKVIDIDIPYEEKHLVVFGRFLSEGDWTVHIGKTQPVQETGFEDIENARVSVFSGDNLVGRLSYTENGWYAMQAAKPAAGESYRVCVEADGFDPVEGTDTLQPKPELLAMYFDTANAMTNFPYFMNDTGYPGVIFFKDSAGFPNFYEMNIEYQRIDTTEGLQDTICSSAKYAIEDGLLQDNELWYEDHHEGKITFSDLFFDGEEYLMFIVLDSRCILEGLSITVTLSGISKQTHEIMRSYAIQHQSGPFDDPMQAGTNIENGYGLFCMFNPVTISILWEE